MHYDWILFDADETLFHFDSRKGLRLMFQEFNIDFTEEDFQIYNSYNKRLWDGYQQQTVSADEIKTGRFIDWENKLGISALELNSKFMLAMAEICEPLDGAKDLLESIHRKAKIGIITNGFADIQPIRLEKTKFNHFIDIVVVSEIVGAAKPSRKIFDHAINKMGYPSNNKVLMVGDNLESDIIGGINAGFDTCWLNRHNLPLPNHIQPTYHVNSLYELMNILS